MYTSTAYVKSWGGPSKFCGVWTPPPTSGCALVRKQVRQRQKQNLTPQFTECGNELWIICLKHGEKDQRTIDFIVKLIGTYSKYFVVIIDSPVIHWCVKTQREVGKASYDRWSVNDGARKSRSYALYLCNIIIWKLKVITVSATTKHKHNGYSQLLEVGQPTCKVFRKCPFC